MNQILLTYFLRKMVQVVPPHVHGMAAGHFRKLGFDSILIKYRFGEVVVFIGNVFRAPGVEREISNRLF